MQNHYTQGKCLCCIVLQIILLLQDCSYTQPAPFCPFLPSVFLRSCILLWLCAHMHTFLWKFTHLTPYYAFHELLQLMTYQIFGEIKPRKMLNSQSQKLNKHGGDIHTHWPENLFASDFFLNQAGENIYELAKVSTKWFNVHGFNLYRSY